MTDEFLKWLVSTGIGGAIGGWALWELRAMRFEVREANQKANDWLVAIHTRLSTLGADSIPPPENPRRRRLMTPPPIPPKKEVES